MFHLLLAEEGEPGELPLGVTGRLVGVEVEETETPGGVFALVFKLVISLPPIVNR